MPTDRLGPLALPLFQERPMKASHYDHIPGFAPDKHGLVTNSQKHLSLYEAKQPVRLKSQSCPTATCFVDGSYWRDPGGREVAGAGLFFAPGDKRNLAVPVPRAADPSMPYDSLRAELYASLLFQYNCQFDWSVQRHTPRVIYTDCLPARQLLLYCRYGASDALKKVPPSRWVKTEGCTLRSEVKWGTTLDANTVLAYRDILDFWWLLTGYHEHHSSSQRVAHNLQIQWVQAHQSAPKDGSCSAEIEWKGNAGADMLAKTGARMHRTTENMSYFAGFPLMRCDITLVAVLPPLNRRASYLPLIEAPAIAMKL